MCDSLKDAFFTKYPRNSKIIAYFEECNGVECTWENLTKVRLQRYADYLQTKVSKNSARTYCAKLKSVLNDYDEEVTLPRDRDKSLAVKRDASQHTYLTIEEINLLRSYKPKSRGEHIIKNRFLLGCVTGARHSDYERFTAQNIVDGSIKYVSIKTHTDTTVPSSRLAETILKENDELGFTNAEISDSYFNRALRKMCEAVGINEKITLYQRGKCLTKEKWRFISSHTARRSFATNLYKAGVDIYTISRLCGHSSIEMTKKYICCPVEISDRAKAFFDSFQ